MFSRLGINWYGYQSCLWSAAQGKRIIPCPRNLIWRDGFGRPVPREFVHSPCPGRIRSLQTGSTHGTRFPRRRPSIPSTTIGPVPRSTGRAIVYQWRCRRESAGTRPLFRNPHELFFVRPYFPTPTSDTVCRLYICMYVYMYVFMYVYLLNCMYVCMYVWSTHIAQYGSTG